MAEDSDEKKLRRVKLKGTEVRIWSPHEMTKDEFADWRKTDDFQGMKNEIMEILGVVCTHTGWDQNFFDFDVKMEGDFSIEGDVWALIVKDLCKMFNIPDDKELMEMSPSNHPMYDVLAMLSQKAAENEWYTNGTYIDSTAWHHYTEALGKKTVHDYVVSWTTECNNQEFSTLKRGLQMPDDLADEERGKFIKQALMQHAFSKIENEPIETWGQISQLSWFEDEVIQEIIDQYVDNIATEEVDSELNKEKIIEIETVESILDWINGQGSCNPSKEQRWWLYVWLIIEQATSLDSRKYTKSALSIIEWSLELETLEDVHTLFEAGDTITEFAKALLMTQLYPRSIDSKLEATQRMLPGMDDVIELIWFSIEQHWNSINGAESSGDASEGIESEKEETVVDEDGVNQESEAMGDGEAKKTRLRVVEKLELNSDEDKD